MLFSSTWSVGYSLDDDILATPTKRVKKDEGSQGMSMKLDVVKVHNIHM